MRRIVIAMSVSLLCISCRGKSSDQPSDKARDHSTQPAATGDHPATTPTRMPEHIQVTVEHGERWLGTYVASWRGFRTKSYWLEGPEGLVLIDTHFMPPARLQNRPATGARAISSVI